MSTPCFPSARTSKLQLYKPIAVPVANLPEMEVYIYVLASM